MKIFIKKQLFCFFNIDTKPEKNLNFQVWYHGTTSPKKFKKQFFWQVTLGKNFPFLHAFKKCILK
jgi:hypothetical protein